jgi:short-subunit dehydrogenase
LGSWLVAHFAALVRYVLAMPSRDAASKSFLQSCTEALQNELRDTGITITAHAGADC